MATWFEITYTGEPTEADCARAAELVAQGFTSGQLINEAVWDDTPPELVREGTAYVTRSLADWREGKVTSDE